MKPLFVTLLSLGTALFGAVALGAVDDVSWSDPAPRAPESLLLDVASVGGTTIAVGERGHIVRSRDGGGSWEQMKVPTRATLTGIYMLSADRAVAVGHDAVILLTEDGGETWELVFSAPEEERPLLEVWFSDDQHGMAVGAYSLFIETEDGGRTWEFSELTMAKEPAEPASEDPDASEVEGEEEDDWGDELIEDFHLHHMARSPSGRIYLAAEAGSIYGSDDGGQSWRRLESPYEGSYFGSLPLDGDRVLLFGLRGHLFRSDDSGSSWVEIETGTVSMLNAAVRRSDGSIIVVGLNGTVLTSSDDGETFAPLPQPNREGLNAVTLAGEHVVAVGEGGARRLDAEGGSAE